MSKFYVAKINGNIDLPKSETKSLNSSNPLNLSRENLQTIWNNNAGTDEHPIKWTQQHILEDERFGQDHLVQILILII